MLPKPVSPITTRSRDHGLVRAIGTWGLAASVVNGVVGAGIFTLPATVALEAGPAAPLAYLVTALVMAAITLCFAEAGSRVPTSGGVYGTVDAAFGPAAGFVAGNLLLISDVLASGGIAALLADTAGNVLPGLTAGPARTLFILAVFAGLAAANLLRVGQTARLITWATAIKLLPLLFFLVLGATLAHQAAPPAPPAPAVTLPGFGRALILTLFAFCGMESTLSASGEVRNPHVTVPRALFLAMAAVVCLYVLIQLTAQHLLAGALPHSTAPLADAAARAGPLPRAILLAGGFLSALVWMASSMLGSSRLIFAFSRDGRLPTLFGRLTPTTHVPAAAILLFTAAAAAMAISGSFLELVILSALAVVAIYSLACAAAVVLHRRGTSRAGAPLNLRALPVAAAIGLTGMGAMLVAARPLELVALAAVIAASLLGYAITRRGTASRPF